MTYDIAIVGGGIVGLATAYQINQERPDLKVILFEKENKIASHQTGNNSGVIHSGVYYKPGSLKAKNCFEGYSMLLDFCEEHSIKYDLCGKVIVATEEKEIPQLDIIYGKGIQNGLPNLKMIDAKEIKELEPHCAGIRGIHVPQAGIVDYKEVSQKIFDLMTANGVVAKLGHKVEKISSDNNEVIIKTANETFKSHRIINCGGLYSDRLFEQSTNKKSTYKILPFRGEYYDLKPNAYHLVKGLIYPVPNPEFPFLGVHFTRTIHGGVESGPNAVLAYAREGYKKSNINVSEFLETISYSGFRKIAFKYWKDGAYEMYRSYSKKAYVHALQKLIPEIKSSDVVPGNAGVRAQAVYPDGSMIDDFLIEEDGNVINVCNAPSPAATSSLSIGKKIASTIL